MVQEHHSLKLKLKLKLKLVAALGACVMLNGCPAPAPRPSPPSDSVSTPESPNPPPATTAPSTPPPRAPNPPRENHLSPATRALVTQAHTLLSQGDPDGASSTLDRALRIQPNNPLLWIERGRLRLSESDAHQAEGCARKALALASGDPVSQKLASGLLADALRAQQR